MNLDSLPVVLSYSGGPNGPGRRRRGAAIDLVVLHTNDGGPQEPAGGAEGLAGYTATARPPDYPAYHVLVDCDSAIRTARDDERVNGAGGVADRAWHICLYGTAAQTIDQWHDPYSKAELVIAAQLVNEACGRFGLPRVRVPAGPGNRGICGHVDVSDVYPTSQGHTDPGPGFPWAEFLAMLDGGLPTAEQIAAYFRLLEELDVEHGMGVDSVATANDVVITLDRWGGMHPSNGVAFDGGGYWPGKDVARKIVLRARCVVDPAAPISGWVQDLNGGLHPFAQKGTPLPPARTVSYWKSGKIIDFAEL